MNLFSYVLRYDDGAAPNPFWNYCTLVICKPVIRRTAKEGDWVIGTGSVNGRQNGELKDFQDHLVYAMKITRVMTLAEYDKWCAKNTPKKIPDMSSDDFRRRAGDCIYDFSSGKSPKTRNSVHSGFSPDRDLGGKNALVSDWFYYFGEKPVPIGKKYLELVKRNQGHKRIQGPLAEEFIAWLEGKYTKNRVNVKPQMPLPPHGTKLKAHAKCSIKDDDCDNETYVCVS